MVEIKRIGKKKSSIQKIKTESLDQCVGLYRVYKINVHSSVCLSEEQCFFYVHPVFFLNPIIFFLISGFTKKWGGGLIEEHP